MFNAYVFHSDWSGQRCLNVHAFHAVSEYLVAASGIHVLVVLVQPPVAILVDQTSSPWPKSSSNRRPLRQSSLFLLPPIDIDFLDFWRSVNEVDMLRAVCRLMANRATPPACFLLALPTAFWVLF